MRPCLTLALFLIVTTVYSQSSYLPGYIVLNSGDTVSGEIDYRRWDYNPDKISFLNAGSRQEYSVSLLKAFDVTGKDKYLRSTITYQLGAVDIREATEVFETRTETKTVWLRVLYLGSFSLYELNTPKRSYFFIDTGEGAKELVYRVRLYNGEFQKDDQYKTLLMSYAEQMDNKDLRKAIESAEYSVNDMNKIFSLLNNNVSVYKETGRRKAQFDVGGGVSFFSYSPRGNQPILIGAGAIHVHSASFNSSVGFFIDPGITVFAQRSRMGIRSRLGVGIGNMPFEGENTKGEGSFDREYYKGTMTYIEPHINVLFSLNSKSATQFLVGPDMGSILPLNKDKVVSRFETDPNVVVIQKGFPPMGGGFLSYGLTVALTGSFGRIELRARKTTNMLDGTATSVNATIISFGYAYIFK